MTKCNSGGENQKELMTSFEVGVYDKEELYPFLSQWWSLYYNNDVLPKDCVPKHGAVILSKDKPVALCLLYVSDTKICNLNFCMVDPSVGAGRKVFFLRHVVDAGIKEAQRIVGDDVIIWSLTDHAVVGRVYQEKGFECLGEGDCFSYSAKSKDIEFLK